MRTQRGMKKNSHSLFSLLVHQCEKMIYRFIIQCVNEVKAAATSLVMIIVFSLLIALLGFTFWALLMSALALLLYEHAVSFYSIIAWLLLVQLILIIPLGFVIRCCSKRLLLPKLRELLSTIT